jgi:hypothetical protein
VRVPGGFLVGVAAACARPPRDVAQANSSTSVVVESASVPSGAAAAEWSRETRWQRLPVPGFLDAEVVVPPAGGRPKPVLVVAHGAGDRPEPHCFNWGEIVRTRGFVVCVRGVRTDNRVPHEFAGYYYPEHHMLTRLVRGSLEAARERFGERIDVEGAAFSGFSQGSLMGALVVARHPTWFSRALFIEGGGDAWSRGIAQRYAAGGGRRIAFLCGTGWCRGPAERSAPWLEGAGLEVRVDMLPGAGHTTGGAVRRRMPEVFDWLVEDDPRWQ